MSWKSVALGKVANVGAGNSAPQDEKLFENGTHNFYRTSDVGRIRYGVISDALDKLNVEGVKGLRLHPKGTILFPKSGASTFLNHRVMLEKEGYVSSHLATIKAIPEEVDDKFLLYFLSTVDAKNLVQDSNYPSLKTSVIDKVIIEIPPLATQKKIVAKLDAIFAEIDKATAAAEANAKNAEALFQSYLKEVFDSEKKKNEGVLLESLCDFLNGYAFKSTDSIESSDTQLLRMGNLYGNNLDLERSPVFYPNSFKKTYSKFILNFGDIVISLTGTVGKRDYGYAIKIPDVCVDLLLNQRLLKIHNLDFNKVNYDYFNFYLHSSLFLDELYQSANGTRQANLSSEYIKKMRIPLCSISEQITHVKSLLKLKDSSDSLRESCFEKIKSLVLLKQSILKQAFNGELIKD